MEIVSLHKAALNATNIDTAMKNLTIVRSVGRFSFIKQKPFHTKRNIIRRNPDMMI